MTNIADDKKDIKERATMKKRIRVLMCLLVLVLSLTACGDKKEDAAKDDTSSKNDKTTEKSEDKIPEKEEPTEAPKEDEPKDAEIKGTTGSWGIYTEILVPDGMKLTPGSQIDKEDENYVWVQKTDNPLTYYFFNASTEEQCKKDVEATLTYNKDYDPKKVTLKTGDYEWKGVTYKYGGTTDVSQMYTVIGEKAINVRFAGFAYDDAVTTAILGSLRIK